MPKYSVLSSLKLQLHQTLASILLITKILIRLLRLR
nr:MAG TPA: hypothetical protein [Caudoviricetes sp.]